MISARMSSCIFDNLVLELLLCNTQHSFINFLYLHHFLWTVWYDFDIRKEYGMNVLGLVVYSVAMGIVVSRLGEKGKPIYHFTSSLADATMKLVIVVIW